jgi:hypothetical protein
MAIASFDIAHKFIESRPGCFCSAPSVIDVLALHRPTSTAAHLSKRLELGLWILSAEVVVLVGVIIEDMAAFAALLF